MKRLVLLTAVLMLTASAAGCRCCDWLWRGAAYPTAAQTIYADPCPPVANPCGPCVTTAPACSAVTPGPVSYGTPPGQ